MCVKSSCAWSRSFRALKEKFSEIFVRVAARRRGDGEEWNVVENVTKRTERNQIMI